MKLSGDQIINSEISRVKNSSVAVNGKFAMEFNNWGSTTYKINHTWLGTKIRNNAIRSVKTYSHTLNFNFFIKKNSQIAIESELYGNSFTETDPVTFFQNITFIQKLNKSKAVLEIKVNNLFDRDVFSNALNTDFTYISNSFNLRPIQILLSLNYNINELVENK